MAEAKKTDGTLDANEVVSHRKKLLGAVDFAVWEKRLCAFLAAQPGVDGTVRVGDLSLPSAGGSSGTLLFSASYDKPDGTPAQSRYVLRYATEGGYFHAYDLPGQYSIMQELQGSGVPVPGLAGLDATGEKLGVVGYVMHRVEGEVAPPTYPKEGMILEAPPAERRRMVFEVVGALARLHAQDTDKPGFAFLKRRGKGATAQERDLDWIWTSLCWACPREEQALAPHRQWLLSNQPRETRLSVNHGDAMLGNYMFHNRRLAAVIDWELAFLGNPANDIAWQVLTHQFLSMGSEPMEGMPSEAEWKAEYERVSGAPLAHWPYYMAVNAFKLFIALALAYREVPPEMEAAATAVRAFLWRSLTERIAAAQAEAA